MSKKKFTETENFKFLRESSGLTLQQLSEMTGYSVATINGLELHNEGSKRLKDKIKSVLLSQNEEGEKSEVKHWRDRALIAEQKLDAVKSVLYTALKKF